MGPIAPRPSLLRRGATQPPTAVTCVNQASQGVPSLRDGTRNDDRSTTDIHNSRAESKESGAREGTNERFCEEAHGIVGLRKCVSALTHHLKKHSFKPTAGNIYAQALQCWLLNREEWDVARNARGQNKGYSSPKTLAAAWLNKKDNNRLS